MSPEEMRTRAQAFLSDVAGIPGVTVEGSHIYVGSAPPLRACYFCGKALCGKALSAHAGFIETIHQPDGLRRDFCSAECLHWQLHEDEKS